MHIRAYRDSVDREHVIALWQTCGLTRPWNDPGKDIDRKMRVQPELFLVGTVGADDVPVAILMGGYDGHRAWVYYLAVHPEHQRKGHARALLAHFESLVRPMGCAKINLQVRTSNGEALAFYDAIGFAKDDCYSLGQRLVQDRPR